MSLNKMKSLKIRESSKRSEPANKVDGDMSMILAEETRTHVERIEHSSKTQESLTPLHSTPKRSTGKSKGSQGQPGIRYQVSPILLPCTQEGGNEVVWDWQSPLAKSNLKNKGNNGEIIGTPKRTTLLQKKRNSNSPLLYEPIKRKLLRNEHQQESIDQFTAEMKALTEQIKTVPKDELLDERTNEFETELESMEIDINDFVECETKFQVTASDENSSTRKGRVVSKTSMEDLFDDSIDDSMVKCSQEVEEKLRLESCRETSSKQNSTTSTGAKDSSSSWHQQSYSRFVATKDKSTRDTIKSSKSGNSENSSRHGKPSFVDAKSAFSTFDTKKPTIPTKNSSSSSTNSLTTEPMETSTSRKPSSFQKSSSANNNVSKLGKSDTISSVPTQTDVFEIPDDSFDDFLAIGLDEVVDNATKIDSPANQASNRYGKCYASPHLIGTNDNHRRFDKSSTKKIFPPPPPQSSCGNVKALSKNHENINGSKIFPRSVSNDSIKPNSSYNNGKSVFQSQTTTTTTKIVGTTTTTTNNQEKKFFKTKSLSTSNCDDQGNSSKSVNNASISGLGSRCWKSGMITNGNASTCVSNNKTGKTFKNDCNGDNNAWSRKNVNEDNRGMWNVDRNAPRDVDSVKLKRTNGNAMHESKPDTSSMSSQSTQKCTPEEIERKRLEAKMKLEAKKKLLGRSTSANSLTGGTSRRPVKR